MGKCIFTGQYTESKYTIYGVDYFVCDECIQQLNIAKNDTNVNNRIAAYNYIVKNKDTFDKDKLEIIKMYLDEIVKGIGEMGRVEPSKQESSPKIIEPTKTISPKKTVEKSNPIKIEKEQRKVTAEVVSFKNSDREDILIQGHKYGKIAYFVKSFIMVLCILLSLIFVIAGIVFLSLESIGLGIMFLLGLPLVTWLMYMFNMFIIEACINIAHQRAVSENTNEILIKLLNEKDESKK